MRIAVWHNLPSGGGKRALRDQVSMLMKRGHHVEIWRPLCADHGPFDLSSYVNEHINPCRYYNPSQNNLFGKFKRLIGQYLNLYELNKNAKLCASEINERKFDVLLSHSCHFMGSPFIGRYIKIPSTLYLHEPNRILYEAKDRHPMALPSRPNNSFFPVKYYVAKFEDKFKHSFYRLKAREEASNASSFDTILVNSYFNRESVLRAYDINSQVCYLGVDTELFKKNKIQPKGRYILAVGAMVREKNYSFLIQAISLIKKNKPKLIIVSNAGNPEYEDYVRELAKNSKVPIEVYYNIPDDHLIRLYSGALLVAYAPRLEPFGYVPLEANACSTPVVAVAEGGVRETVVNELNGLLIDHDPQSMADAINSLLHYPEKAAVLGENGRNFVEENWSLEKATDRLEMKLARQIGIEI